jgi:hypothetical protein
MSRPTAWSGLSSGGKAKLQYAGDPLLVVPTGELEKFYVDKKMSNFPSLKPYGPYPAIPSYHVKLVIYSRYVPIYIPIAIMSSRLDRWGRLSGHDSPAEIGNMCYLEVVAAGIQMVPLIKSVNSSSMHWGLKIPMLCLPSCSLPGSLVSCLGVWGNTAAVFAPIRRYADRCVVSVYIGAKAVYRCIGVLVCARAHAVYRYIDLSVRARPSVYRCIGPKNV